MVYFSTDTDDPNYIQKIQINDIIKFCANMDKISKKIDKNIQVLEQILTGYDNEPDEDLKPFFDKLLSINTKLRSTIADLKVYNYKNYTEYSKSDVIQISDE